MPRPNLVLLLVTSCFHLLAAPVTGQDTLVADEAERHTDLARSLFAEGVAFLPARDFVQAEARFRQALALHEAPSIRVNLASTLYEQGEYPEAQALASDLVADATTPAEISTNAQRILTDLAARAGYLRLEVTSAEGAAITLDSYVLAATAGEVPVTPGTHVVVATRGDHEVARGSVEVALGEHATLPLDASEPVAIDPMPVVRAPPPTETWWFWAALGGGAAIVVGVIVGVAVASSSSGVEGPLPGDFQPGVLRW